MVWIGVEYNDNLFMVSWIEKTSLRRLLNICFRFDFKYKLFVMVKGEML